MKFQRLHIYGYNTDYDEYCEGVNRLLDEIEKVIEICQKQRTRKSLRNKLIKIADKISDEAT